MAEKKNPNAYNWIIQILGFIGICGGAFAVIHKMGQQEERYKSLMFPDVHSAVKTIEHVDKSQGEEVYYKALRNLDTIAKATLKDTKTNARENFVRDSIRDAEVHRNTVTNYQIKDELKKKTKTDSIQSVTLQKILEEIKNIH